MLDTGLIDDRVLNQIKEQLGQREGTATISLSHLSVRDALDAWLTHEGIIGYTDEILRVIRQLQGAYYTGK